MTLRGKLLWAQVPLVAAVLLAVALMLYAASRFGAAPGTILHDNFRSFDAGLTMLRSLEALETTGDSAQAVAAFAAALRLQEGNITESGEIEATAALGVAWQQRDAAAVRQHVDTILRLNRDAMDRKAGGARLEARYFSYALVTSMLAALGLALLTSAVAFRRILTPLRVLEQATRRVAFGDFDARVRMGGDDEVAAMARAFNDMAHHLAEYRKSSLGELLEANNRLQAVMDSLADAVIVYDNEGFPTSRNQVAIDLVGERNLPEHLAVAVEEVRSAVLEAGEPVITDQLEAALEVPARPQARQVLVSGSPVRGPDGVITAVTITLRDVTRLKKLEGFRGDLVATAAHELRTPLTALHMSVHLCLEGTAGPLTATQQDLLAAARDDCERLQAVVNELLELARLESGAVALDRAEVPVAALLAGAAQRHQTQARLQCTEIIVESCQPLVASVDVKRMAHVLDNLIDNALGHGQGPVHLSAEQGEGGTLIHVDDAGPGIPSNLRDQVFEKFFRVPGTMRPGAGLGLGLVRDLVRAHGGRVSASTSPSGGTRVTVHLPPSPA